MSRRARRDHLSAVPAVATAWTPRDSIDRLIAAIGRGEVDDDDDDDDLARLRDAVVERLETIHAVRSASALLALEVGDRIALNHSVRPQYLHGASGTVTSLTGDQALITLDRPIGRFRSGRLRCSPLALEKLESTTLLPMAGQ